MAAQIKHLFVLMMENRSLDHMLGFMKAADYDIEGLDPANLPSNEGSEGNFIYPSSTAQSGGDLATDPNHHFEDTAEQIYGFPNPPAGTPATMSGFVRNYAAKTGSFETGANIMKCFAPANLPYLTTLAREYGVCDHWFSSVPGPTLPNRLFAHCGTGRGRLDMSPDYFKDDGFYTVYEELAKHHIPSAIFYHDWSGTLSFNGLMAHPNLYYSDYTAEFVALCNGLAERVPAYCFIEPRYSPHVVPGEGVYPANDQHPDHSVEYGETLIQNVYNAIRQNDDLWHSSMLIIVYDEHGGIYDHVPPVPLPAPDKILSEDPPFDFSMSGVRVPAVVISPYIQRGTISKEVYDHTSLIATAMKLFAPGAWPSKALGDRAEVANTLDSLLDLNMAPRDERPNFAGPPALEAFTDAQIQATLSAPLSGLQKEMVAHAAHVNASLPPQLQIRTDVKDVQKAGDASTYLRQVTAAALAARQGVAK